MESAIAEFNVNYLSKAYTTNSLFRLYSTLHRRSVVVCGDLYR